MNIHQGYQTSLLALYLSFVRHRKLIMQMAQREVLSRYQGSMIGLAWSFFNPLFMLCIYTFFFSYVFKSRWGIEQNAGYANFAIVLFVGLIIHGFFAECINRAPTLISSNINYVKKIVFPLETFPWISIGSALFHMAISILVLLTLQLITTGSLAWTLVFFPFIFIPLILTTLGFSFLLASMGVFLRDISQVTSMMVTILLFVSPVFYPVALLPSKIRFLVLVNPLAFPIEESRKVLLFGQMPDWYGLGTSVLVSITIAWAGFWWFQKTRRGFSDVL